ncbi:MAG TPA: hypothetical protein VI319_09605 [Burkholderiales bacterium]
MQTSLRQKRLREQRSAFLAFMVLALIYLLAGLPIVYRSLAAQAAHAAPYGMPGFATLDRNHDGYVDSSETALWPAYAGAFARADLNGDGRLDAAEFRAGLKSLARAR